MNAITLLEAAFIVGRSVSTVRRLVDTGEIQGEWIAGRRLVARDSAQQYAQANPAHIPDGLRGQHEER